MSRLFEPLRIEFKNLFMSGEMLPPSEMYDQKLGAGTVDNLLLETSFNFLLEDGSYVLLES